MVVAKDEGLCIILQILERGKKRKKNKLRFIKIL